MAEADRARNTLDKRQTNDTLPPALNQGLELSELVQPQTPPVSQYYAAQETASSQSHSSNDNTRQANTAKNDPWRKKFLLTLDGGGVRGYSTLLIIQELMKLCHLKEQREDPEVNSSYHPIKFQPSQGSVLYNTQSAQFLPVHYFDYIAGTSTGGLIAIMLSRLRMTIDDCIEEYTQMGARIFGSPRLFSLRGPIPWKREKYDSKKLEQAVKDVDRKRNWKSDQVSDSMYPSAPDRCRTIVVAVRENNDAFAPYLFRTYEHPRSPQPNIHELNPGLPTNIPIWKVARATTAAPTYLSPLFLNKEKFLDGGFGDANNPTWHAYCEVGQMNGNDPEAVALTVSIGTGKADRVPPVARRGTGLVGRYKAIIKYSAAAATDSEKTHRKMDFLAQRTGHHYERFNVDGGLGDIDLGEWKVRGGKNLTFAKIRQQTMAYLNQNDTKRRLHRVAKILVKNRQERSKTPEWNIVSTGHRYRCTVDSCLTGETYFIREEDLRMHLVDSHEDLGYVYPPKTRDQTSKLEKAIRLGKILHAD